MNTPVRTTIFLGLIISLVVFTESWILTDPLVWKTALKITVWLSMTVYSLLLARWSHTPVLSILVPALVLLGAALWPTSQSGFLLLTLGVFSWIRTGICFREFSVRAFTAEILTASGGPGLIAILSPDSPMTWALSLWLFFLVQSLYLLMVPGFREPSNGGALDDAFELARKEAEKVIGNSCIR